MKNRNKINQQGLSTIQRHEIKDLNELPYHFYTVIQRAKREGLDIDIVTFDGVYLHVYFFVGGIPFRLQGSKDFKRLYGLMCVTDRFDEVEIAKIQQFCNGKDLYGKRNKNN